MSKRAEMAKEDLLENLVGGCSKETFLEEIHENRSAWFKGKWPDLNLRGKDILRMLEIEKIKNNARLADHGEIIRLASTKNAETMGSEGCKKTVVIDNIDRFIPQIKSFCQGLGNELGVECRANAYYTPARSRAFDPHFDSHDVFIMQLEGKKVWQIQSGKASLVTKRTIQASFTEMPLENDTILLEVGESLYIPRGQIHVAYTESEDSLHLTIGMYPVEWSELVSTMLDLATYRKNLFRQGIGLGPRKLNYEEVKAKLDEVLKTCIDKDSYDQAIKFLEQRLLNRD